ncbi:MAG: hypothetical protein L6W00_20270 [Lentisphaeria bacterium]|nr:MAG: hypothetical protein L6W00_20270 [Lentisphaeria bacterium]
MPGKESTPPFQSKLTPYRNEILKAWFRRQTLREIQAMLQKHGITISPAGDFPFHQAAQEQIRSKSDSTGKEPLLGKAIKGHREILKKAR